MSIKKTGLGRGLSSLIPTESEVQTGEQIRQIAVSEIKANPYQPRRGFQTEGLQELANSIREHGVLEPLILRLVADGYELVAGERRWRAAALVGMTTVPAVVRLLSDQQAAEMALIENIQRQDLNAIEEATAYQRLILEFGYSQEELADKVGKSRPHVTNILRLLQLPREIQAELISGSISMGHARALLPLKPALQLLYVELIKSKNMSVRQLEDLVQATMRPDQAQVKEKAAALTKRLALLQHWESQLKTVLQTKARIKPKGKGGKIEIIYFDEEELQRLLDRLINSQPKAEEQ
ncbi:MAG: ParB/RepB/Spo0J family partition protein [Negativicutes bacterium]|nr:ParB/RepB/Spo0J family partition protein [Negativicutes bacterium]